MLDPVYKRTFIKEAEKAKKRGKDTSKLEAVIKLLCKGKPLDPKYKEHKLKGEFSRFWECHIEPDWLLIYIKTETAIIFTNTGSHSDLF